MLKTKAEIRSIIHLPISVAVVIPGAFVYRYFPDILYQISITAIDQQNTLKSLMAVYLEFLLLWLFGVFKPAYLKVALISNIVFMYVLGFGSV